jgi:methyl-accepting chemotaxis protein
MEVIMRKLFIRVVGLVLLLTAVVGLLLCVAGVVYAGRVEGPVTERAVQIVDLIGRGLKVAADGLAVANTTLQKAEEVLAFIETTVDNLAQIIADNKPIVTSLATVTGEDIPTSIDATQGSLAAAQDTARVVDDTIATIRTLPFLPQSNTPPTSLQASLANISSGLENLSNSFKDVQASLNTTADNLDRARRDLNRVADDMREVQRSMSEARAVVIEYQIVVARLQNGLPAFRANLPGWIRAARIVISLGLLWLGMMQIGLFAQGWGMLGLRRARVEQAVVVPQLAAPAPKQLPAAAVQTVRALTSRVLASR